MSRTAPAPSPRHPADADDAYLPRRFTPVPRASKRPDGWTTDRQYAFIAALTRLPSVAAAARSVGMRPGSAYRLRRAPGAEDFAIAWDEALDIGLHQACSHALDRATIGEPVVVTKRGVVVGTAVRHDDRMLLAVLLAMRGAISGGLLHQKRQKRRREVEIYGPRFGGPSYADYLAHRTADEIARDERVEAAARPFVEAERKRARDAAERAARARASRPSVRRL